MDICPNTQSDEGREVFWTSWKIWTFPEEIDTKRGGLFLPSILGTDLWLQTALILFTPPNKKRRRNRLKQSSKYPGDLTLAIRLNQYSYL